MIAAPLCRSSVLLGARQSVCDGVYVCACSCSCVRRQHYASAVGGCTTLVVQSALYIAATASMAAGNWWLSYWSDHRTTGDGKWFLGMYALLTLGALLISLVLKLVVGFSSIRASRVIHGVRIVYHVSSAPPCLVSRLVSRV